MQPRLLAGSSWQWRTAAKPHLEVGAAEGGHTETSAQPVSRTALHKMAAAVAAGPAEDACDLRSGSPACVVLTGGDCSLLATHINGKHLQAASRGDEVRGMACQLGCHSYSNSSFTGKWQEVKPDRACCCSLKAGYISQAGWAAHDLDSPAGSRLAEGAERSVLLSLLPGAQTGCPHRPSRPGSTA